ncbi:MAG: MFS transporter [Candidatus Aminicenantes bacterium]|nr:MFS transporter [Candidatus Aminicenantes bacterium]
MTQALRKSLRESPKARWAAMFAAGLAMLCGYFMADVMAPLKPMLEQQLHWTSTQYGFFTSAYGWLNVFLFMLLLGGIILDKMGVRFTGIMSTGLMVGGALLKYFAISHVFDPKPLLQSVPLIGGMSLQVYLAGLGYAIFGVGVEVAGITTTKLIVKWFKGKEMALAMGLQLAMARLGTALALMISAPIAVHFKSVSAPVLLAVVLLIIGFISYLVYGVMDRKLDASEARAEEDAGEEPFRLADIKLILKNKGFWYISMLCLLFYSAVFPFLKYANDLMIQKYHVKEALAGIIPGLLPFGNIFMTPIFGRMIDRKGKAASIMYLGSAMLIGVHLLFAIPLLNHWLIALLLMLVLGVAFSLVPSAMWPSVPKMIPEKQLGSAYALIFYIQNWGLMGVPYLIGWILDRYCVVSRSVAADGSPLVIYNYTIPMLSFMGFGILGIIFAYLLKSEDKRKGYGLELPSGAT